MRTLDSNWFQLNEIKIDQSLQPSRGQDPLDDREEIVLENVKYYSIVVDAMVNLINNNNNNNNNSNNDEDAYNSNNANNKAEKEVSANFYNLVKFKCFLF